MERSQLSREFSARVQTNFHKRGDPFRFWMWIVSLCVGFIACAWILWNSVFGSPEIYNAGSLSTPHQMFENRCEVCHVPFSGPMDRILSFGRETKATSAPDEKCLVCHDGAGHFFSGDPDLSYHDRHQQTNLVVGHERHCAECHREHDGKQDLKRISSEFCIGCHSSLHERAGTSEKIDPLTFQHSGSTSIRDFADHPEFLLHELASGKGKDAVLPKSHGAHLVVADFLRQGETEARWQDQAAIRFNHAKHLKPKDSRGLPDAHGDFHDLSHDCSSCHKPDAERSYMEPVNFEMHCSSCHPLVFDAERVRKKDGSLFKIDWNSTGVGEAKLRNEQDPGDIHDISELKGKDSPFELLVVPHESPEQVRGFLTDMYAKSLLQNIKLSQPEFKPNAIVRPLPGESKPELLSPVIEPAHLIRADRQVALAESLVRSATFTKPPEEEIPNLFRTLHWLKSSGGCGFCHESSDDSNGNWTITKPNIPDRWFRHAKFHHDAHRMLKCVECHSISGSSADILKGDVASPDIYKSSSTGDILIPKIAICKNCHSTAPAEGNGIHGARTDCLECHVYHQRDFEKQGTQDLRKFLNITSESKSGD